MLFVGSYWHGEYGLGCSNPFSRVAMVRGGFMAAGLYCCTGVACCACCGIIPGCVMCIVVSEDHQNIVWLVPCMHTDCMLLKTVSCLEILTVMLVYLHRACLPDSGGNFDINIAVSLSLQRVASQLPSHSKSL